MRPLSLRPFVMSLILSAGAATALHAQPAGPLTLEEALRLASAQSESVQIAEAGETRADAEQLRAFSQRLPQVNFTGAYTRTLASEFSSAFEPSGPVCDPFCVDTTQPLEQRVAEIERAATCGSLTGGGLDFSNLPFGQRNIYQLGLIVLAGGLRGRPHHRAGAPGGRVARRGRSGDVDDRSAGDSWTSPARSTTPRSPIDSSPSPNPSLDQADAAYEQTRLAFDAGRQPEFELLRAQVARDNQRPTVIRRRADRDVAYLRLRQLLELPADAPLTLDVDLENPALPPPGAVRRRPARPNARRPTDAPLSVRQSQAAVDAARGGP